jgi:iron complex transport system substrate-binding protein
LSRRTRFFLIALALAAAGCTQRAASAPAAAPRRIVSLLPSFTQIVVALGAGDRLVGRTQYCPTDGVSPRAVVVGGALDANFERILALKPDLVLVQQSMTDQRAKLGALGLPVLAPPTDKIADAYVAIREIARRLQVAAAGETLAQRVEKELADVRDASRGQAPPRALLVIGHSPGELRAIYAAAPNTFLDELLHVAGGVNALPAGPAIFPQVNAEEILHADPDAVIVFAPGEDGSPAAQAAERNLWRALPYLRAVKAGRVYRVVDPFALSPGPEMARTARTLELLLRQPAEARP